MSAAALWWKAINTQKQMRPRVPVFAFGSMKSIFRRSIPICNSLAFRGNEKNTKLFFRPATQRTKLEYFQDHHGELINPIKVAEDTTIERVVGSAAKSMVPTPQLSEGEGSAVVRQRGPRQKYRSVASDDLQRSKDSSESSKTVLSITTQRPQRCVAYCTAESYDFERLLQHLQKHFIPSLYFSEVIHVSLPRAPATHPEHHGQEGDVFYFKDGCVVFWDIAHPHALQLLGELAPFEAGAYERRVVFDAYSEEIGFHYGKQAGILPTGELVLSIGQHNWAKTQVRCLLSAWSAGACGCGDCAGRVDGSPPPQQ